MRPARTPIATLLVLAGLWACSDDDPVEPVVLITAEDVADELAALDVDPPLDLSRMTRLESAEHVIYWEDIVEAEPEAPTVAHFNEVLARYDGWLSDGTRFAENQTHRFQISTGDIIAGWDLGLIGAALGATRRLVIPPYSAYGAHGSGTVIPGNTVLVFEVTVEQILILGP